MTTAALFLGLWITLAAPDGAGPPDPLVLEVAIDAGLTDRNLGAALLQHLRAELAASNVAVTSAGAAPGSVSTARLTVGPVAGSPRAVSLEIRYRRSGAAVQRTLDLSALPADGALMAIAAAVDELIRASWSLTGVASNLPRPPPPPPPVPAAPAPAQAEVRILLAGERHRDGTVTLGPDVVLAVQLGDRLSVDVRGGWRGAGARRAPDGAIESSAVTGGVGASLAFPAPSAKQRAGAELAIRLEGAWVSLHGTPRSGATGYSTTTFGAAAVGGVGGWLVMHEPLRLVAFAGWQLPLRSIGASDGNQSAAPIYQPGFSAAAGIGARF
jgi:hypothetical protein